jgi:voltage-gated potassium channel
MAKTKEKGAPARAAWKRSVEEALEGTHPRLGRSVGFAIQALIIISVISIGLETLPNLPPWAHHAFWIEEIVVVAVFTAEYALRIAIAPNPWRYIFSFWGIVDLIAVLPFYLGLGADTRGVRAFRLVRLLRLLKLAHYSAAAERMMSALKLVAEELIVFALVAATVTYLCAFGLYYFEHDAQPEKFASVFHAMWAAAITLTTVGYGDVVPITLGGRIFTMLMLFIAIGVVAVPTGLVASALSHFREEERRLKAEERAKKRGEKTGAEEH